MLAVFPDAALLYMHPQGSTLEKKPWGQLAPKILDLVASTNVLVAKKFSALQVEDFYSKISFDTIAFIAYHLALNSFSSKEKER